MIDDREVGSMAAFRLHEVATRLGVLSRVATSPCLQEALRDLANALLEHERRVMALADATVDSPPASGTKPASSIEDQS